MKAVDPFLQLVLERLKLEDDILHFFRLAYVWRFPHQPILDTQYFRSDVTSYESFGIEPPYVQAYLCHIKNEQALPSP